jgi:predicted TPR repeat methyltransferase
VEALCHAAGLTQIEVQDVDVRLEAGAPVKGFLVVARKPV